MTLYLRVGFLRVLLLDECLWILEAARFGSLRWSEIKKSRRERPQEKTEGPQEDSAISRTEILLSYDQTLGH
jgi:hypothetical protein